ncbi:MAG: DUF4058 family protein [Planctomycetota bacterium]|nr:DUF4058 family protein [Planctomycetota bacterium]
MPSPFPGMDPYIESQLWEEFHASYINGIRDALVSALRPHYHAGVEKRVYLERRSEETARTFVADVAVFDATRPSSVDSGVADAEEIAIQPNTCTLPWPEEHRESYLVIRRPHEKEIITVIEFLSPTNKLRRANGREIYLEKRMELLETRTHFVEVDLLRGGERMPFSNPPKGDYFALVSRASRRPVADVYGWPLSHRLPTIPIPLAKGDPDTPLDLQAVFDVVFDRAGYDYALDYALDVSPSLTAQQITWVASCIADKSPTNPENTRWLGPAFQPPGDG